MQPSVQRAMPYLLLFFALLLFRVPFFLTGHIQDDAFISLRCARTLAETGVYGFNIGERVSASTSHLYVFIVAGLMRIFGENFLAPLLALNAGLLLMGLGLIAKRLFADLRSQVLLWTLISLLPAAVLSSTLGMETGLLIFLLGAAVYFAVGATADSAWLLGGTLFLLPWCRPDALAAGSLLLLWKWRAGKQFPILPTMGLAAAAVSLLLFNHFYFGAWLNQTITAKSFCFQPSHSPGAILQNLRQVFVGFQLDMGFFSPVKTRHLIPLSWPIFLAAGAAMAILFWRWLRRGQDAVAALLALLAVAVPVAYALGGIIFPWYLYPWNICAWLALFYLLLRRNPSRLALLALFLSVLACSGIQWVVCVNEGASTKCLADMGRQIRALAAPGDTLFLEPAGTVPFYARIRTLDEVGLVSPLAGGYQEKDRAGWYLDFLQAERPAFLFLAKGHETRPCGNVSGPVQGDWMGRHYKRIRLFECRPADYQSFKIPGFYRGELAYELYRLK